MDKIRCCTCKEIKSRDLFSPFYRENNKQGIHKCKKCVYEWKKKSEIKDPKRFKETRRRSKQKQKKRKGHGKKKAKHACFGEDAEEKKSELEDCVR